MHLEVAYMLRAGIIDDTESCIRDIEQHLERYCAEHGLKKSVMSYASSLSFLDDYQCDLDVLFIDVQMPYMDGMELAEKIRKKDPQVFIVFVTNYAQYAIRGYTVHAFDYMIKPVLYGNFEIMMDKLMQLYHAQHDKTVTLMHGGTLQRLYTSDIYFVESSGHYLIYHTAKGDITKRGKLQSVEDELRTYGFARCHASYLVNLEYVESVQNNTVTVMGVELPITRGKRDSFWAELTLFAGKGGIL